MLLTGRRRARAAQQHSTAVNNDSGYVLVAVMALLLLVTLLSTAVVSSVLSGITSASTTRASLQSQVAADAGIDVVRGGLVASGSCVAVTTGTHPSFTATISYTTTASVNPYVPAVVWVLGCPPAEATFVKIVSVGRSAVAATGAGNTGGNSLRVEGILVRSSTAIWSLYGQRNLAG